MPRLLLVLTAGLIALAACGNRTSGGAPPGPTTEAPTEATPAPPVAAAPAPADSAAAQSVPTTEDYEAAAAEGVTAETLDTQLDALEKEIGK
jgi:ABC-type glycerol-3-phosphate transport system substrate-binding protein